MTQTQQVLELLHSNPNEWMTSALIEYMTLAQLGRYTFVKRNNVGMAVSRLRAAGHNIRSHRLHGYMYDTKDAVGYVAHRNKMYCAGKNKFVLNCLRNAKGLLVTDRFLLAALGTDSLPTLKTTITYLRKRCIILRVANTGYRFIGTKSSVNQNKD